MGRWPTKTRIYFSDLKGTDMKHAMLATVVLASLGLAACDRPTVVSTPSPAVVTVPGPTIAVPGPAGPQGTAGIQGAIGMPGATGTQGSMGTQGADGASGQPGKTGAPGYDGAKGEQGKTGGDTIVVVPAPASNR
jgi:hypothetical protein